MRVEPDELTPQRRAGEALDLDLAARRGERVARRRPDDFGVVGVGDDHAALPGEIGLGLERRAVELGRQAPVEAVAVIEIIKPFRIAQKVGEEAVETVIASLTGTDAALSDEAADLLYHLLVLLRARGMRLEQVLETMRGRGA